MSPSEFLKLSNEEFSFVLLAASKGIEKEEELREKQKRESLKSIRRR